MPIDIVMAPAATVDRPPTGDPAYSVFAEPVASTPRLASAVPPGAWGRPLRPEPSRPARGTIGWATCPPPAPEVDLRGSTAGRSDPVAEEARRLVARATRRGAPVAALAVALVGVAAVTHSSPHAASPQRAWAAKVTPYLDAVALDVGYLDAPLGSGAPVASTLSASEDLRSELNAGREVGRSPVASWGRLWTSALHEAQAALSVPASAERTKLADLSFAADDLVALGQEISAER